MKNTQGFHNRKWRPYYSDNIFDLIHKQRGGCWIWKGTVHQKGHPIWKGWQIAARVIYMRARGVIPSHKFLRSKCGNLLCVNPRHRELFTTKRRK